MTGTISEVQRQNAHYAAVRARLMGSADRRPCQAAEGYWARVATLDRRERDLAEREALLLEKEISAQMRASALDKREVDLAAREAALTGDDPPPPMKLRDILLLVGKRWELSVGAIASQSRTAMLIAPRRAFIVLAREFTVRSLPHIGLVLGGRDHTTILHHERLMQPVTARLRAELGPNAPIAQWLDALHAELMERH